MKQLKSFLALTFCGALALATQSCSQKNDEKVPDFTRGAWKKLDRYHHYLKGE